MAFDDFDKSYRKRRRLGSIIGSHPLITAVLAAGILILAAFIAYFVLTKSDSEINLAAFESDSLQNEGSVNKLASGLKDTSGNSKTEKASPSVADGGKNTSAGSQSKSDKALGSEQDSRHIMIEGVSFPIRDSFIDPVNISFNWGDSGSLLEDLSARMSGKYVPSTVLWFDSDTVEFSHQGVGCDGVKLYRDDINYKIALSTALSGSAASDQSAEVLKAMLCIFSSKPDELYEAIFDSYTSSRTHGLNTEKYTIIGDAKIKIKLSEGKVVYLIHSKGDSERKYTVVLDPGHGGCFAGAVYNNLTEKKISLELAKKISDYLTGTYPNVKVVLTRKKDVELSTDIVQDLEMRAELAKEKNADILVSLHFNASTDHNAKGATVYVTNRDSLHEDSASLGQCILNKLIELGIKDRGVQTRNSNDMFDELGAPLDYYAINRHCSNRNIIGIIVEHCFMDNGDDQIYIDSDEALERLAKADAEGIADYLGL